MFVTDKFLVIPERNKTFGTAGFFWIIFTFYGRCRL